MQTPDVRGRLIQKPDADLRRRMRRLPEGSRAVGPLGPGTCAPLCAVPGLSCRGAVRYRASGARGGHASRFPGQPRVSGRGCHPRAAQAVSRQTLARAPVPDPRRAASCPSGLRLDRRAAEVSGARYSRSLGSAGGGRSVTTAVLSAETGRQALRQVKDPELDMNNVDLGLVYDVGGEDRLVGISMTFTSPGGPAGPGVPD